MNEQVTKDGRIEANELINDIPTRVHIPGTNRYVLLRGMKPYTIERLTRLWVERDIDQVPQDSASTLKSMCKEPYFNIKQAAILSINNVWGLKFYYPIKWRIWAFIREYKESQMLPIIQEGKKKLPLMAHWQNMAFSVDMRMDWVKMTKKEAEQYRAELLSGVSVLLSKNSQNTENGNGVFGLGGIGVG